MSDFTIPLAIVLEDIRTFIYGGFQNLPLSIISFFIVFGLMTANYAMMILLVGLIILTPPLASILTIVVDSVVNYFDYTRTNKWFKVESGDLCGVISPFTEGTTSPSKEYITAFTTPWFSIVVFFFGYILTNAILLYSLPSPSTTTTKQQQGISERKYQTLISIIALVFVFGIVCLFRYQSGCESRGGMIWTTAIFGCLGFWWYMLISKVGQGKLSDLFGISNRLLTPSALYGKGVACFPVNVE